MPLLLLLACQNGRIAAPEEGDCTGEMVPSVLVTLEASDGAQLEQPWVQYSVDGGDDEPCEAQGEEWVCGWEEPGEIRVTAWAEGREPMREEVTVEAGICHVETEEILLVLPPECGDTAARPSVLVTVYGSDGTLLTGADVEYLPLDGNDYTAPMICDTYGDGTWACGWELAGEIEIWVTASGWQGHYEVIEVGHDGCNVITETLDVVLER